MASGIFMIFDDIAMLMDDMALATKKTAGILGDDLAVNADKASGFSASRELPVLWEITKGSFLNKLIILPMVFLMSAFVPWLIVPILMLGGVYLAYEGAEKIYEYFTQSKQETTINRYTEMSVEKLKDDEADKIKSAIMTDFILSIEIIIIALGAVLEKDMLTQISVVSFVAVIATIGVYGIVALIVRIDDFGYMLVKMSNGTDNIKKKMGEFLIALLPKVIKSLTVIGTIAMLLVAGGIYVHNIHVLHELLEGIPSILGDLLIGSLVGLLALIVVKSFAKIRG
jgi:predicted DNA repair protein MutK